MVELADAQDLGSCAARRVGSTPTTRIQNQKAASLLEGIQSEKRLLFYNVQGTGMTCSTVQKVNPWS